MKHLNYSSTYSAIRPAPVTSGNPKPVVSEVEPSPIPNPQSEILSFFFFLLPFYFLLLVSCEKSTTPVTLPNPQITLTVEDVAVTEAWLHLAVEDRTENLRFTLLRDDSLILNGPLTTNDTTLYDANLLPAQGYTYRAELQKEGQKIAGTEPVNIMTMDTTSHNFTWQIDTIGDGNSSVLRDVFIIDENDIWAVGEISVRDSTGNFINPPFNVAHWNGQEWELITTSAPGYGYGEIFSVFAFGPNDVWVGSSIPEHWDGNSWTFHGSATGYPGSFYIYKIWGTSSDNLYFIGPDGNIIHYNGQGWQQMGYGLEVDMHDIWGDMNPQTGELEILVLGSNTFQVNQAKLVLRVEGLYLKTVPDSGLSYNLNSLWFKPGKRYYIVGNGAYSIRKLGEVWQRDFNHPSIYKSAVRGVDINNIFITGSFGLVSHFNGMSWHHYAGSELPTFYGTYGAADYKGNLFVAVGDIDDRAIILRGYKH